MYLSTVPASRTYIVFRVSKYRFETLKIHIFLYRHSFRLGYNSTLFRFRSAIEHMDETNINKDDGMGVITSPLAYLTEYQRGHSLCHVMLSLPFLNLDSMRSYYTELRNGTFQGFD